jgi:hypothetical protein
MIRILQAFRARMPSLFHVQRAGTATAHTPPEGLPRSGWPPLSLTPLLRRRCTDAGRWSPKGIAARWTR